MSDAHSNFHMKMVPYGGELRIVMSGCLDEKAVLEIPIMPGLDIHIDATAIDRVTPQGVRILLSYLSDLCVLGILVTIRLVAETTSTD